MASGQSLSVGSGALPISQRSTSPIYQNLKLIDTSGLYDLEAPMASTLQVEQLKEPIRPIPPADETKLNSNYPKNIHGETPQTALAEQLSELSKQDCGDPISTVHSVVGKSGMSMQYLTNPANLPYQTGLYEARALKHLAKTSGKSFGYGAIVLTHGEADASNEFYEDAMINFMDVLNKDITAITGQPTKIPLFISQQNNTSNWQPGEGGLTQTPFAHSAQAQWLAGVHHPGLVILSGPKYTYRHRDGVHLDAMGYELMAEKLGQAIHQTLVRGKLWHPLQPRSVHWALNSSEITVSFDVPTPPLQWNEALTVHQTANTYWKNGRGFEVINAKNEPLSIRSVEIVPNSNDVRNHLNSAVSTGPLTVQYAMTQDGEDGIGHGGSSLGRRGQLRYSNPFVGLMTGIPQANYSVAFSVPTGWSASGISRQVTEVSAQPLVHGSKGPTTLQPVKGSPTP